MFFSGATLSPLTVVLRCNKTYTESSAREKDPETLTCETVPLRGPLRGGGSADAIPKYTSNCCAAGGSACHFIFS